MEPHSPALFTPLKIRGVEFRNRIMLSPMCQYSATDGFPNDWHLMHLGSRAAGGVGVVISEATAIEAAGRISASDLGIWSDAHIEPFSRLATHIHSLGAVGGLQLAHAGRKASTKLPWVEGPRWLSPETGGWESVGPSPIPFGPGFAPPRELTTGEIGDIIEGWANAARRSAEAGFKVLEIHAAHGYLIHEFLSPIANSRTDEYGGSFENRTRFALEVVDAIRSEWTRDLPLFMRISATDWIDDAPSWRLSDSIELARLVKPRGVDLIDCSSGSMLRSAAPEETPGFQVPFAEAIRKEAGVLTAAVGMITTARQAEDIIASGQADLVALGRVLLANPSWPLRAANELGVEGPWPNQYLRARTALT